MASSSSVNLKREGESIRTKKEIENKRDGGTKARIVLAPPERNPPGNKIYWRQKKSKKREKKNSSGLNTEYF